MIDATHIDSLIGDIWRSVQARVEQGHPLSSEKTLCFMFALELGWRVGQGIHIDFENQCYEGLDGESKYLDLLFYQDPKFKVAIEFKIPRKSRSGNSNQTQTRKSVYRDLARLHYLKTSDLAPSACYFLMAANENCYLNNGKHREHPEFKTFHGFTFDTENGFIVDGLSLQGASCAFNWENINTSNKKLGRAGSYAWLSPIRV